MNNISNEQLLSQLRSMAQQAGLQSIDGPDSMATSKGEFASLLQQSIKNVNRRQQYSGHLAQAFELGDPDVDLAQVMVEGQKARIAFETMSQVRNKLISAYQEIMNMPI